MTKVSLRKLFFSRLLALCAVFAVITTVGLYFYQQQGVQREAQDALQERIRRVQQSFVSYLDRAEFEVSYLNLQMQLGKAEQGEELDLLFAQHDILFFGGLDFFLIQHSDGRLLVDPRARLYTGENIVELVNDARSNDWSTVSSPDGATFFVYKKRLERLNDASLGYLYGFVSLNNNLTLASELLEVADADNIVIFDENNHKLLDESTPEFITYPAQAHVHANLDLPVRGARYSVELTNTDTAKNNILNNMAALLGISVLCFLLVYLLIRYLVQKTVFDQLERLSYYNGGSLNTFVEFQATISRINVSQAEYSALDRRFQLLLESTHCAIIFCDELAGVESMNKEAKRVFPEYENAKTVFDFTPLDCHQPIQKALKGELWVRFPMEIPAIDTIYEWQLIPFFNESSYRGIVMIGKNVTRESRLSWQLEQLQPALAINRPQLNIDMLLDELTHLSSDASYGELDLRFWLTVILGTFNDIRSEPEKVSEYTPFGKVIEQECDYLEGLVAPAGDLGIEIDCPLSHAQMLGCWDRDMCNLVRLFLLMAADSNKDVKKVSIRFNVNYLQISLNDGALARPLYQWMTRKLTEAMRGELKTSRYKTLSVNVPVTVRTADPEKLRNDLTIALISLEPHAERIIREATSKLHLKLIDFDSVGAFFKLQRRVENGIDVLFLGHKADTDDGRKLVEVLQTQHDRKDLPIINVGQRGVIPEVLLTRYASLLGTLFDYSIYRTILRALESPAIPPFFLEHTQMSEEEWYLVGGSRVTQAIWQTELEKQKIVSHWVPSLEEVEALVMFRDKMRVILLEEVDADLIQSLCIQFPQIDWVTVVNQPGLPDSVLFYQVNAPYTDDKISRLMSRLKAN